METRPAGDGPHRSWLLTFHPGDEAIDGLAAFARAENVEVASFTAIGGFETVSLGFYNLETGDFDAVPFDDDQAEVLSLVGEITTENGAPRVHGHVVLGRRDGTTRGGHLLRGVVRPVLIVTLTELPEPLEAHHA